MQRNQILRFFHDFPRFERTLVQHLRPSNVLVWKLWILYGTFIISLSFFQSTSKAIFFIKIWYRPPPRPPPLRSFIGDGDLLLRPYISSKGLFSVIVIVSVKYLQHVNKPKMNSFFRTFLKILKPSILCKLELKSDWSNIISIAHWDLLIVL